MLFLMPQEYHFTTKKGEKEKEIKTEAIAETESRTRRSSSSWQGLHLAQTNDSGSLKGTQHLMLFAINHFF